MSAIPKEVAERGHLTQYPEVQGRVTKWFGTKRVDWCWGEQTDAWKDQYRHWLEIPLAGEVIQGDMYTYRNVAYLKDEACLYIAFTAYHSGEAFVEQPMQARTGMDR